MADYDQRLTIVSNRGPAQFELGPGGERVVQRGGGGLVTALSGLAIAEYAPNAVKKSVIGNGHGDKTQIRAMVRCLLPRATFDSADAADALAIAITHAHFRSWRFEAALSHEGAVR